MKVQDLRIGNLVTINNPEAWPEMKGIPVTVRSLKRVDDPMFPLSSGDAALESFYGDEYSQFDEFIEPIPLTEEWLIKCGFEKLSHYEEAHTEEDYVWEIEAPRSPVLFLVDGIFHEDNYGVKLQFVHQLQNLYYALTGSELTIKEQ